MDMFRMQATAERMRGQVGRLEKTEQGVQALGSDNVQLVFLVGC